MLTIEQSHQKWVERRMTGYALAIAPIFLLIVLGHLLRKGGIPNVEFWNLNDKLVYWVLMPALLFDRTSTAELSPSLVGSFAVIVLSGFCAAGLFGYVVGKMSGFSNPVLSSVIQGACRHNTFLALAIAERLFGEAGLTLAALVTAMLIPATNLALVPVMVLLHPKPEDEGWLGPLLKELGRNPLLVSVALGVVVNLIGIGPIPVLNDMAGILGAAALPIVLMCIGANIRFDTMRAAVLPLGTTLAGKMLLFPIIVVTLAQAFTLSPLETQIVLLYAAVPTATSAYTLARQFGGDSALMAAIISIQTLISFLSLPFTVWLVGQIAGLS